MIRKACHIIWMILLISVSGRGQEEARIHYPWSFGISAGDILHELFNAENENKSYAAFVFEYATPKYGWQVGFRPGYNLEDTEHEGFLDTEVTEQFTISGDAAMTRTIFSGYPWLIRAGLKVAGGYAREDIVEDSGFDQITTRRLQWNAGLGPVVDFRLNVHPRISLGTEASLIYSWSRSELQQLFSNFPDFDTTKDIVEGDELEVFEPATIYLRFHF